MELFSERYHWKAIGKGLIDQETMLLLTDKIDRVGKMTNRYTSSLG
jgi:hypothetical protein